MDVILASDARYLNTAPVLDELMQDSLNILLPTSAAAVWGWTVVSVFVMDLALPRAYLIFFLSLLTIWAGDRLRQRYLNLAVGIYLAGLALVVTILAISFSDAAVLYLYMLVVLITAMLTGPRATGVATIVSAALVLTIGQRVHQMPFSGVVLPLLLIVLTALTTWLSAQRLFTALAWSLTMTREAQKHADEAQKNRGEIARILKSLDEAYVRLERAHEGLIFAREAAEKAYRFKTEFVTSVSHELRTPLNLIVGFSEMMATAPESYGGVLLPSQYRGDVMAIYSSAKHLRDLINDVLDLSRIEGGRLPLSKEPADLAEVVHEAAGMVRGLAESRGLRLDVGLSSRLPMLRLDRTRIRQVLLNLLTNAIRFTDAGWIRVRVGKEGTEAVVVVQDSGRGISPEGLARAFEAFSQLEEDRERQGSGLGLAVSKKFVELHGGRMWIESEVGRGTMVGFALPLPAREEEVQISRLKAATPILYSRKEEPLVLVIHDDPNALDLLRRYVEGCQFVLTREEARAHEIVAEITPLAVLVDAACASRWREMSPVLNLPLTIPIITCSLPNTRHLGVALGASDYLTKPVTRDDLVGALARLPRHPRKILVVDDDPDIVRLLARMLRAIDPSLHVMQAFGGKEGLEIAHRQRPGVILLDLVMPEVDGFAFLEDIGRDDRLRETQVIIVSVHGVERETAHMAGDLQLRREAGFSLTELVILLQSTLTAIMSQSVAAPTGVAKHPGVQPGRQAS